MDDHFNDDVGLDEKKSDFLSGSIDDETTEDESLDLSDEPSNDAAEDDIETETLAYMGLDGAYEEGRYSY